MIVVLSLIEFGCKPSDSDKLPSDRNKKPATLDSLAIQKVRFHTQWLPQAQFAGIYIAYEKGFYRDYGIDVIIESGGPDDPSASALTDNNAEFVSMFLTTALREIDQGKRYVNIAQLSQKSSLLLVARKSSGIKKIQDLNGKKIGLWINDFQEPSIILLNKYNIKAEIVPVSWTTNVLAQGVVDAMNMMLYNEYDIFVNSGYDPSDLTVFALSDYGVNIPEDGIYCRQELYKSNPELCYNFAEATLDGWIYALNHEEESLSIVLRYLKLAHLPANIPHQRWMLRKVRDSVLSKTEHYGRLTEKDYSNSVRMMLKNKVIHTFLPYNEFVGYADSGKN